MEFLLGLVAGAVLGVMGDRLWSRVERIPRLDIIGAVFKGHDGEGYNFTITNRGLIEIPPYTIYIYNPNCGSIALFTKDKKDIQLPEQKVEHRCVMVRDERPLLGNPDFYRDRNNNPMNDAQRKQFIFRLVLDNSDKVIYENKKIGNTFVKVFQNARETKNVLLMDFKDAMALQYKYEPLYVKVLKKGKALCVKLPSFMVVSKRRTKQ